MYDFYHTLIVHIYHQAVTYVPTVLQASSNATKSLPDAVIIGMAGGAGVVIAKGIDWLISRSAKAENKEQIMYTRQRELDSVKDNLIGVFQTQITDLREQIDDLINKNRELHEGNIALRYEVAECNLQIARLKEKLGITNGG